MQHKCNRNKAPSSWLVKPYPDSGRLTHEQRAFNLKFGELRSVIPTSIGHVESSVKINYYAARNRVEKENKTHQVS